MQKYLDFEKPVAEIENQIAELNRLIAENPDEDVVKAARRLRIRARRTLRKVYGELSPWQKTQVARHPDRPHCLDFIKGLITDFTPLAGDRCFAEDNAMIGGIGYFRDRPICVLGTEKGVDTESRIQRNFGMARPEGYRKAARLMGMANRFSLPVLSFIDTPGAYPGVDAEERGQAEAIARATDASLSLETPFVAVVIGEGGSGGAVAIASANYVLMLEHAVYSVISPEGAASILWRDSGKAQEAATSLRLTAQELYKFKIIDAIVKEPVGGAHRNKNQTVARVGDAVEPIFATLSLHDGETIRAMREEKYLEIGRKIV